MAYLNGNCTFLKPSLEIENTVIAERPTATKVLSYGNGDYDCLNDYSGVLVFYLYESFPELPDGTEIKSLSFLMDGEWHTLESLSAKYEVYENVNKKVRFNADNAWTEISRLYFEDVNNELGMAAVNGVISEIEVTYYTD
ncbi:MAG: hypothetical protein IKU08_09220 [Clostridia bacterium]|nr:hypothetical protein [Clostridia bacterium]